MDLEQALDAFGRIPESIALRNEIVCLLALTCGESVVDVGCGLGHLCSTMASIVGQTGRVEGVDIAPELIAGAQRRNDCSWLSYHVGDALALEYGDRTFDALTCVQVAEYLPRADIAIREAYRVLKPGGRAVLVATDWDAVIWHSSDATGMDRVLEAWRKHCFDAQMPRTLAGRAMKAGFSVDMVKAFPILNLTFRPQTYSRTLADVIGEFVLTRRVIPNAVYEAWLANLSKLDQEGRYFFFNSRFLFHVHRPGPRAESRDI
jgi:SAM-dependent methyltransferase